MYHLTCPTCQDVTDSPFVRSGAVVRCESCRQKYRIKSAHFERVIHTGPRTLDEADSVLRSDSVDIEPDEASPVSIDDDGNVVGLSGLSELMRWSDENAKPEQNGKAKRKRKPEDALKARLESDETPLPAAKVADAAAPSSGRRSRPTKRGRRRRKNQTPLLILAVVFGVLIGGGLVILLLSMGNGDAPEIANDNGQSGTQNPTPTEIKPDPDGAGVTPGPIKPDNGTEGGGNSDSDNGKPPDPIRPDPGTETTDPPGPVNKDGIQLGADGLPLNAPTELLPTVAIIHEDWYLMDPPREPNQPVLTPGLVISEPFRQQGRTDTHALVIGKIRNFGSQSLVHGEIHVMLRDKRTRVFAETYFPLMMLSNDAERAITLPIESKLWGEVDSVSIGVRGLTWADSLERINDLRVNPVVVPEGQALRISCDYKNETPLMSALIHARAIGADGKLLKQFLLQQRDLGITKGKWLDLLISTPLEEGLEPASWSVDAYRMPDTVIE